MRHSRKGLRPDHLRDQRVMLSQSSISKIQEWRKRRTVLLQGNSKAMDRVSMLLQENSKNQSMKHRHNKGKEDNSPSLRGSRIISSNKTLASPKGKVPEGMIMILDHIIKACLQGYRRSNNSSNNNGNNNSNNNSTSTSTSTSTIISIINIIINSKRQRLAMMIR